jgi:hypothetical protein
VLVLVGLLHPLVPLFVQNFTRTVKITMSWPELPRSLGYYHYICLHHPLEVCIRKNICTQERGAGLGWVAAPSGSIICPELH